MIKVLRSSWRWLYHPVTVFLLTQVLWIFLMVVWIQWYVARYAQLRGIAEQFRTQAAVEGFTWIPLIVGAILLTLFLAGATVIFLYWNKQHRLNQMQRTFVSNVTHELKSPVASIQLALETMAMRRLSDGQKQEYLDMMLNDAERLSSLIDRILGAARIERKHSRYNPEPLSMRRFVEEILSEDRHLFEKDGHVVVLEKGKDARVSADRSAMRMVFGNLIENAARYSPRGSTIRLRILPDLRSCRLDVIDEGVGIPRKDLRNIFKMFWRGGQAQSTLPRGTGLGLYIVRNIVSDHKGKVWATSPGPRRGSIFSVRLPRLRDYWKIRSRKNLPTRSADRI
jgi:signal transduction histidine kinase